MSERIEITSGLKQAMERGYSLEQAKASFINSGFNSGDVEDSARQLTGFATQLPQIQPDMMQQQMPKIPQLPQKTIQQQSQIPQLPQFPNNQFQQNQPMKKKKSIGMLIFIIVLIIVLVGLAGFLLGLFFFKQTLIDFLSNIGINLPV